MARILGAFAILFGIVVVGFSPERWDRVVLDLARGHGIHVRDLLGVVFVLLGIAFLWRAPRSSP